MDGDVTTSSDIFKDEEPEQSILLIDKVSVRILRVFSSVDLSKFW